MRPPEQKPGQDDARPRAQFDQVYRKIIDKRKWQMAMEDMGTGEASRESTAFEIKEGLEHLKKLDSQRAIEVCRNLGSSIGDVRRAGALLS